MHAVRQSEVELGLCSIYFFGPTCTTIGVGKKACFRRKIILGDQEAFFHYPISISRLHLHSTHSSFLLAAIQKLVLESISWSVRSALSHISLFILQRVHIAISGPRAITIQRLFLFLPKRFDGQSRNGIPKARGLVQSGKLHIICSGDEIIMITPNFGPYPPPRQEPMWLQWTPHILAVLCTHLFSV